jgi:amino acid permease
MDFYKNNWWFGFILGLAVPIVGMGTLLMVNDMIAEIRLIELPDGGGVFRFSDKTLFVLAVCCTLIPFRYFSRHRLDRSMSGIIAATIFYVALFFVWYLMYPNFSLPSAH